MAHLGLRTGDWILITSPSRPDTLSTDGLSTIALVRALAIAGLNVVLYTVKEGSGPLEQKPGRQHIYRYEGSRLQRRADLAEIASQHIGQVRDAPTDWEGPFKMAIITGPLTADRIITDLDIAYGDELPRVANFYSSVEKRMAGDERRIDASDTVLLHSPYNWTDQLYPLLNFDGVVVDRPDEADRLKREMASVLLRSGLTSHRIVRTQLALHRMSELPAHEDALIQLLPVMTIPLPSPYDIRDERSA